MKSFVKRTAAVLLMYTIIVSCSDLGSGLRPEPTVDPATTGVYIMNSGMMDSNNSELTFFNIANNEVATNVFMGANGKRLGDSANDMIIYGSKMYIAVTGSAVVFVTDLNGKLLGEVVLKGEGGNLCPRQLTAAHGRVYVTYLEGYVGAIDTLEYKAVKSQVGPYPEGIAFAANKLFVAITDGNNYPNFQNKVQFLDPYSLNILGELEVAYNPQTFHKVSEEEMYLVCWGDYGMNPAALQKINPQTGEVVTIEGVAPTNMTIGANGKAYILSSVYDDNWNQSIKYYVYDLSNDKLEREFISSNEIPNGYCIAADNVSGNIYIGTSDYISNGDIYIVSETGDILHSFDTGAINPYKVCFIRN